MPNMNAAPFRVGQIVRGHRGTVTVKARVTACYPCPAGYTPFSIDGVHVAGNSVGRTFTGNHTKCWHSIDPKTLQDLLILMRGHNNV